MDHTFYSYFTNMLSALPSKSLIEDAVSIRREIDKLSEGRYDGNKRKKDTHKERRDYAQKHLAFYTELKELSTALSENLNESTRLIQEIVKAVGTPNVKKVPVTFPNKNLELIGVFEDGTLEWHKHRHEGVGGSDIACLVEPSDRFLKGEKRPERIKQKALPLDESIVQAKSEIDLEDENITPAERGSVWEPFIRQMFAERHPELNVVELEGSYRDSKHPHRHANFDGGYVDENGVLKGIIEIKTGTTYGKSRWGSTLEGLSGVPLNYKYQVLWYCLMAGVQEGVIVAVLDGNKYVEYWFTLGSLFDALGEKILNKADLFWEAVEEAKVEKKPEVTSWYPNAYWKTIKKINQDMNTFFSEPGVFNCFEKILHDSGVVETRSQYHQIAAEKTIRKLIHERGEVYYGVDIETSALSASMGYPIQVAVVKYDSKDGTIETVFNKTYGLDERDMRVLGVGMSDVHGLTPEKLEGLPPFKTAYDDHKTLIDMLRDSIIVSHNASFEQQWLGAHLPGLAEALDKGKAKFLDTRFVCNRFIPTTDNKLSSFCGYYGIPYENAHDAESDTKMMMQALKYFIEGAPANAHNLNK